MPLGGGHRSLTLSFPPASIPPQDRLEFLYAWAVDGPPVVIPLGLLARPKTYLTAVLQVRSIGLVRVSAAPTQASKSRCARMYVKILLVAPYLPFSCLPLGAC